ncbi:unnamed protein product, partial [Iphiclides podalirius]
MKHPLSSTTEDTSIPKTIDLDFSRILSGDKRKNPFSKCSTETNKKTKLESDTQIEESNDKTLFALLKLPSKVVEKPPKEVDTEKLSTFSNLLQKFTADHTVETIAVVLETHRPTPSTQTTNDSSFVRCLDTSSPTLDTSPRARFHQTCLYWQHPQLPWLQLFPRSTGRVAAAGALANNVQIREALHRDWTESFRSLFQNNVQIRDALHRDWTESFRSLFQNNVQIRDALHRDWTESFRSLFQNNVQIRDALHRDWTESFRSLFQNNVQIRDALHRDWTESFRSLFQLLRARHCPYFYVCANTFTCLFRAAGMCGVSEPCALIAPTTRGFRQTLRQEDVEFTMPLRPKDNKKRLNNSEEGRPKSSSFDSCYDTMDDAKTAQDAQGDHLSGDEEDPDQFLSQLGLESEDLRKINNAQARLAHSAESSVDSAAASLVAVRGADAQALFNFLLNCKSVAGDTGALAGVPPTLLAPTAFHGGALHSLQFRENTVHVDSKKYYSIELRGPILPTTVPALFKVLRSSSAAHFSATFAHLQPTLAFSWAAESIAEDESTKENEPNHFTKAFNKENLSDCGISEEMLQLFCSSDPSLVKSLDSVKYNAEDDTYTW